MLGVTNATMGAETSVLTTRCAYGCAGRGGCASGEGYETWLSKELHAAIIGQDVRRVQDLMNMAPYAKDREFNFLGEEPSMSALALALQNRHIRVVHALLDAGVSPNLRISEHQRNVYAQRSQLAALNGGDPDLQNLVPTTHFESLCATQHKELFMLLLDKSANPNSGIIQVCYCGDLEMLDALLSRGCEPNCWTRNSSPLISAVKSKIEPHEKVLALLRFGAEPNFLGSGGSGTSPTGQALPYPPLTLATRRRDYKMVRMLLEAGADVNQVVADEGLPNVLFWATYWGELELIKLFLTLSKHPLDFTVRKYTNETLFDVVQTSKGFAGMKKPRHIAKLPLPSRPPVVYEKIAAMLEEYRDQHQPASISTTGRASCSTVSPQWTTGNQSTPTCREAAR